MLAALEQFAADAQRLIERMAEAEHPRIAVRGTHGAADLVGERLKSERVVGGGERARERFAGPVLALRAREKP